MLLAKGKIMPDMIALLDKWRHTGFNVYAGSRILPRQEKSMENLARYIIRASFSQERMVYQREKGQVVYRSKDGSQTKVFDVLEWLAAMCSHVPNRGEQMARYYGYYSNVSRVADEKNSTDDTILCILVRAGKIEIRCRMKEYGPFYRLSLNTRYRYVANLKKAVAPIVFTCQRNNISFVAKIL